MAGSRSSGKRTCAAQPGADGSAPRLVAGRALLKVLDKGRALDAVLDGLLADLNEPRDRALARRLSHAVLRDWPALDELLDRLISRRPARRDRLVWFILAVGLAELRDQREPAPAVVNAAVAAVAGGGLARLKGLANAVLRNFQRRREALEVGLADDPVRAWGYPGWLIEGFKRDWPEHDEQILAAGNQSPPLWLRVNRRYWPLDQARAELVAAGYEADEIAAVPDALVLRQRAAVSQLPGFSDGGLSVQDGAAQLAVEYLDLADGLRVLDACSAPGGKAAHILERAAVELTALDIDKRRLEQVSDNFQRLGLEGKVLAGDAADPAGWWDGRQFDRILVDAPCSATGVIRRHPDIRWLRKAADIPALVELQRRILDALWSLLAPGGILVYATCSVLAAENRDQGRSFLERHEDADVIDHQHLPGTASAPGRQILPGSLDMDGFYHLSVRRLQRA